MTRLTPKQARFVDEYLIDLNATQAAIRAGYSKKSAYSTGQENLKKPVVAEEIRKRRDFISQELQITQERVARELARIGFADINPEDVKPGDKNRALAYLGKLLGLEAPAKHEVTAPPPITKIKHVIVHPKHKK